MTFTKQLELDFRNKIQFFQKDAFRIWNASILLFFAIILSQVIFGLLPLALFYCIGLWIDRIVAADSIGIWTSDVSKSLQMFLGFSIIIFVVILFTRSLNGVSERFARSLRWVVFIISTFILFVLIIPVRSILIALLLILKKYFVKYRILTWMLVLLILAWFIFNLTEAAVFEVIEIRDLIIYSGLGSLLVVRYLIDELNS